MNEEAVKPQDTPMDEMVEQEEPVDQEVQEVAEEKVEAQDKPTMVPLSALQKQRGKNRELELELQWEKQRNAQKPQEAPAEDESIYETATRGDIGRSQEETVRIVEEKLWIRANPEKYERVNEYLPKFLKQRPNLASAISLASNRYEEAYLLMDALTPKEQKQLKKETQVKREAPNAPGLVPKAASMNETVDVMSMSDSEFKEWRSSKKRAR